MSSLRLKRLLKQQVFEKKAIVPVKKRFWPSFSHFSEHDKPQRSICKGTQGILTSFVQMTKSLPWDLRGR